MQIAIGNIKDNGSQITITHTYLRKNKIVAPLLYGHTFKVAAKTILQLARNVSKLHICKCHSQSNAHNLYDDSVEVIFILFYFRVVKNSYLLIMPSPPVFLIKPRFFSKKYFRKKRQKVFFLILHLFIIKYKISYININNFK